MAVDVAATGPITHSSSAGRWEDGGGGVRAIIYNIKLTIIHFGQATLIRATLETMMMITDERFGTERVPPVTFH